MEELGLVHIINAGRSRLELVQPIFWVIIFIEFLLLIILAAYLKNKNHQSD
jgi:hypothetical protein